jgi:hypothetical protein
VTLDDELNWNLIIRGIQLLDGTNKNVCTKIRSVIKEIKLTFSRVCLFAQAKEYSMLLGSGARATATSKEYASWPHPSPPFGIYTMSTRSGQRRAQGI